VDTLGYRLKQCKLSALGIIMILISTSLVVLATLVGARFRTVEGGG